MDKVGFENKNIQIRASRWNSLEFLVGIIKFLVQDDKGERIDIECEQKFGSNEYECFWLRETQETKLITYRMSDSMGSHDISKSDVNRNTKLKFCVIL